MSDEAEGRSSFWTSVPGVLAGVAAIITAVGALLGTLAATGAIHFGPAARASLETAASIQSFGSVQVGQGSPASVVTVSNRGKAAAAVAATLEGAGAGDFAIAVSTCANVSLPANMSCQLQLTFAPRSQGDKAVTLRITADNADLPPPLLFTGTGSPTSASSLPSTLSVATDANGNQVEYNGHPLYTYSKDTAPGPTNGEGFLGKWFVATPTLQGQSAPQLTPTPYGY